MPPPPGMDGGGSPAATAPTTPQAASPASAQPAPQVDQGTQAAIGLAGAMRLFAQAVPAAAPEMAQMAEIMRQAMAKMMQSQQTGEPAAPPMPG